MEPRTSTSSIAVGSLILWTIAVATLAGYASYRLAMRDVRSALEARPAVIVVDVAAIATNWKEGDTPQQRATNGLAAAKQEAARLAAEGYVVLDRQYVLAAPEQHVEP